MTGKRILMVSMGAGGNGVASAFLDTLLTQCGVGPNGEPPSDPALAAALEVFCDRRPDGRLVPRRLLAATPDGLSLAASRYTSLYPAEAQIVESANYGGHNWAKGQKAPTIETLAQLADEKIAELGGECIIWLFFALGGGYGSGGGSRFMEAMLERQGGTVPLVCIPILPVDTVSGELDNKKVEHYNAVLALRRMLDYADQALLIDNEPVLYNVYRRLPTATFQDLNAHIAASLSALVSPILWPDAEGGRLTAEAFHANLWNAPSDAFWAWASPEAPRRMRISERLVAISNPYEAASPGESDAALAARLAGGREGLLSAKGSGDWTKLFAVRYGEPGDAAGFASAIPGGHARLAIHPGSGRRRAVAAGAHTGLIETLQRLQREFEINYQRKALLHWYSGEGLDEVTEFNEAGRKLDDAISDLKDAVQSATPEDAEE